MPKNNVVALKVLVAIVAVLVGTSLLSIAVRPAADQAYGSAATLNTDGVDDDAGMPVVAEESSANPMSVAFDTIKRKKSKAYEGQRGFSCALHGNRVCGPKNKQGAAAGCYRDGVLVIPWTRYDVPSADPLWAQLTPPC
jgi:uncharacterized low-complexity protein